MDISNLATKDNAENGQWFQFTAYGKKWPFELKIRGNDSDEVQQYTRKRLKNEAFVKLSSGKTAEMTDSDYQELMDTNNGAAVARLAGIRGYRFDPADKKQKTILSKDEPVVLFGREIANDKESYLYLIEQIPAVKDFVLEKSGARENFLSEPKNSLSGR